MPTGTRLTRPDLAEVDLRNIGLHVVRVHGFAATLRQVAEDLDIHML